MQPLPPYAALRSITLLWVHVPYTTNSAEISLSPEVTPSLFLASPRVKRIENYFDIEAAAFCKKFM